MKIGTGFELLKKTLGNLITITVTIGAIPKDSELPSKKSGKKAEPVQEASKGKKRKGCILIAAGIATAAALLAAGGAALVIGKTKRNGKNKEMKQ